MDSSLSVQINGNSRQWGGQYSSQGDAQNRRRQKFVLLMNCLKAGELEGARQAFTALINAEPAIATDPGLTQIGAALQSSNLYSALHFAAQLESRNWQIQAKPWVHPLNQNDPNKPNPKVIGTQPRIDFSA